MLNINKSFGKSLMGTIRLSTIKMDLTEYYEIPKYLKIINVSPNFHGRRTKENNNVGKNKVEFCRKIVVLWNVKPCI